MCPPEQGTLRLGRKPHAQAPKEKEGLDLLPHFEKQAWG